MLNTTRFVTLEEVKNCKSLESYKYFVSGWVLKARWKVYICQELVLVSGRVRHSFSASKAPLEPWAIIRCNGAVLAGHCTCMAGLAETCSHVGALLYWVESAVRIQETACTSQDDMWITPNPVEKVPYLQLRTLISSQQGRIHHLAVKPQVDLNSRFPSPVRMICMISFTQFHKTQQNLLYYCPSLNLSLSSSFLARKPPSMFTGNLQPRPLWKAMNGFGRHCKGTL